MLSSSPRLGVAMSKEHLVFLMMMIPTCILLGIIALTLTIP